jgi:hypothetical protein
MAVDKELGGFYYTLHDNQDANVPWLFSTSFVSSPTPINVTGYQFLTNGRCWNIGAAVNPNFPLRIPADAAYIGDFTAYGKDIQIWQFLWDGSEFDGQVQVAVVKTDLTILFMNGVGSIYGYEPTAYLFFETFNTTRPEAKYFARPPGPCPSVWTHP